MSRPLVPGPAGLSSDTLEHFPPSLGHIEHEENENEQWSDAHDTLETDEERDVIEEIPGPQGDLALHPAKAATTPDNFKTHEMHTPSPTASSPAPPQGIPSQEAEEGSVRSLPIVQVTEPSSPVPMNTRTVSEAHSASPATSLAPTTNSSLDRRSTLRAQDTRASNRISGFFSNLIHRRDNLPPPARETMTPSPSTPTLREASRTSSPLPSRAATPPPSLPPPALSELGLSLSSITSPLSPSHFTSPPCSGAFLQPHYLLLCHAQGLDVLPLVSPPAPQPYSLIRRVPFKSVVVMEHRGVLVAIAGRRDGVRVYALEEVKRAVEWRVEMEVKRERDRNRREEVKRATLSSFDRKPAAEKNTNNRAFPSSVKSKPDRRATVSAGSPTTRARTPSPVRKRPQTPSVSPDPVEPPPAYTPPLHTYANNISLHEPPPERVRTTSVSDVLAGTARPRLHHEEHSGSKGVKDDWDSSDDEAIDLLAAPSGSQALDERTSAAAAASTTPAPSARVEVAAPSRVSTSSAGTSRHRPANLDLSLTRANPPNTVIATGAPPSPTPTLLTLRQALMASPGSTLSVPTRNALNAQVENGSAEADDEEEVPPSSPTTPTRERISLAEALLESRLPDLPPAGTRRPQTAVLLGSGSVDEEHMASPRTSESFSTRTRQSLGEVSARRRRRWSVFDGIFPQPSSPPPMPATVPERVNSNASDPALTSSQPEMRQRLPSMLSRSQSTRLAHSRLPSASNADVPTRPSTAPGQEFGMLMSSEPPVESPAATPTSPESHSASAHGSRFLPRIITNAFHPRRSDDRPGSPKIADLDGRKSLSAQLNAQAPAPKLEYVKLPGTKGSVMVKAVETAKKSFLAILCGENGEKVELFAGTYRTALGLSRTFILPDSPRSLELQLQGDDLVEVFLVFSQNVFGLEPATVRVREVRIGRAERRAARRRLREAQQTDTADSEAPAGEDDTAVNVTIGVAVAPPTPTPNEEASPLNSPLPGMLHPADTPANPSADIASAVTNPASKDELLSLAAAHNSPYTTFQQLTFSPNFPLAAIADEYVIPPTYPAFLQYRANYEPEEGGKAIDLSQVQFSPPGLPVPPSIPPSQWYYRDPKGVVHGPWPESLMQQWYKDALLPPDLPVRREEEVDYTLLKDLRLQCVDPTHPFRNSPPQPQASSSQTHLVPSVDPSKPLLSPISVLCQPRHFGPPPLFFSSRGGHSTTIVDARGRSILKGRFMWSPDEDEDSNDLFFSTRLGDVKRLEAFDVQDRAILVALRQGGVEVVDFGDALLLPADSSRTEFPHFHPPTSSINRRGAYIWRIGERTSPLSDLPPMPSLPLKSPHRFHGKKSSTGPSKSLGRNDFSASGDPDSEHTRDEVFFLGRKDDSVYFCERRFGSFRVLRLSPLKTAP